ncbi:MAG TPA: glycogen/starch/alpha-glucan phosphorylase, partial [Lamprocystis sp. (in: g-proteobacteria)]|nr:glycogen/starch/alpha-glucan phosphorylase [Lamprocystis sp. (in: g-proteobacteria)]
QAAGYHPWEHYQGDDELKSAIDLINTGLFSHGDPTLFRPLTDHLVNQDPFMVLADYRAYADCQAQVSTAWADRANWDRMSILNVARMGKFSSDRAIRQYAEQIWHVQPMPVSL